MTTDSRPGTRTPVLGDVILGKYELCYVLGTGGMGTVYAARHLELDRQVAVKFLHAGFDNTEVAARFLREARAAAKIESEHVARVLDVARLDDHTPFIVMEYLEGQDLSSLLEHDQVSIDDAVDYVVQVCAAMSEAHQHGIVHRDLKPANLFLTRRRDGSPLIKVLDFGISKWNDANSSRGLLTNPTEFLGSPAYMSPEQLRSALTVDQRTDIWSIGMILFELLGGRPAFDAPSLAQLMASILNEAPIDLRGLRPEVPEGLAAVVDKCLAKDREQRFGDVVQLALSLMPFAPERTRWDIERISRSSGFASTAVSEPPPVIPLPAALPSGAALPSAGALGASGSGSGKAADLAGKAAAAGTVTPWVGNPQQSAAPETQSKPRAALLAALAVGLVGAIGLLGWFGLTAEVSSEATSSAQPSAALSAAGANVTPTHPAASSTLPGPEASSSDHDAPLAAPKVAPATKPTAGSTEPSTIVTTKPGAAAPSAPAALPKPIPTTPRKPASTSVPAGEAPAPRPKPRTNPPTKPNNPLEMDLK